MMRKISPMSRIVCCLLMLTAGATADDLSRSTWQIPSHAEVQQIITEWVSDQELEEDLAKRIIEQWNEPISPANRLAFLGASLSLLDDDLAIFVENTSASRFAKQLPDLSFLPDRASSSFLAAHIRLIYARWLVQNELYNETLEELEGIAVDEVIDPAALLFYRSIAHYRLLEKEACLPIVDRLLEKESELPQRFAVVAQLIRDDIKPLEKDSLDEISRLMDSIRVRLGHSRVGKRVRTEEDEVIKKLDKMIKEKEKQAQSSKSQASSGSGNPNGNLNPSAPMEDSMPGGGRGPGNVDAKDIGKQDGWGNLPAKERQQALQEIGKDFPSHYRDVIEEYFRKLAKEGAEGP